MVSECLHSQGSISTAESGYEYLQNQSRVLRMYEIGDVEEALCMTSSPEIEGQRSILRDEGCLVVIAVAGRIERMQVPDS